MKSAVNLRVVLTILIFIAVTAGTVGSCYVKGKKQHDFEIYYSASLAYREGLDPYQTENLSKALGKPVDTPFVYPPDALFVFRPLTFFDYQTAARIFLTLKLLAVGVLIFFWDRIFNFKQYLPAFLLVAPLAFNGTILDDLSCGNVSVLEQFFIWIGFYFYARDKIAWFAAAIVLASTCKFTPILLLAVLLTRWRRRDFICLGYAGISFLLILALNRLIWPQMFSEFFQNVNSIHGETNYGAMNPAILPLATHAVAWLTIKTGYLVPGFFATGFYIGTSFIVIIFGALTFVKLMPLADKRADLWRICLMCFVYALILPRLKNYSYIVLIAPIFYAIISRPLAKAWVPFCGLLVIYTYGVPNVLGNALAPFFTIQRDYYCLIIAWVIAGLFCYSFWRKPQSASGESASLSLD